MPGQRALPIFDCGGVELEGGLHHDRRELLDEERVAAAAFEEQLDLGVGAAVSQHRTRKRARSIGSERVERDEDGVVASRRRRPAIFEVGATGGEQDERPRAQALEQSVNDVEHELVGPVEIGDGEHQRSSRGKRLEQHRGGPDRFVACASGIDGRVRGGLAE